MIPGTRTLLLVSAFGLLLLAGCAPLQTQADSSNQGFIDRGNYGDGRDFEPGQGQPGNGDLQAGKEVRYGQAESLVDNERHTRTCDACGKVRSISQVAGSTGVDSGSATGDRYDLYRIDVDMDNGGKFSFDQKDADGLQEGSAVVVRDGHVHPSR